MSFPIVLYRRALQRPRLLLAAALVLFLLPMVFIKDFSFDASADTLVVEGDPKLATYGRMSGLFGGDEFLVLAYSPHNGRMFDRDHLDVLAALQARVAALPGVAGVFSVLDAPLVQSPPIPVDRMSEGFRTLRDVDVDLTLAREELRTSPLFRNFLVSPAGDASVIRIDLARDTRLQALYQQRDELRADASGAASAEELAAVESEYQQVRQAYVQDRQALLDGVRSIREAFEGAADIYISGVPMIAADMIEFVKSDLAIFGSLVFAAIVLLLFFFFRRIRWVVLPIVISATSILVTMGLLGFAHKPVTVISSNFISLLAIICISFSIHLIVRYRELLSENQDIEHAELVLDTMESKFAPCVYTGLTTMLAFGSMLSSRIVPVEDFGWMMCLGILVAFIVTYTLFPALLLVLGKGDASSTLGRPVYLTNLLSRLCQGHAPAILLVAFLVACLSGLGLFRVSFDNRFVDYFDDDTDIYQGMVYIDEHLGGTVPFDVYLQLGEMETQPAEDDFFAAPEPEAWPERYWFTRDRIETVGAIHQLIDQQSVTGKVISIYTLDKLSRGFNDGEALSNLELAYVLGELPPVVRDQLILPYARPDVGFARISARVKESGPYFSRTDLVADIRSSAREVGLADDQVIVTGMMVLFNDMLVQLADSQLRTLVYVVLATLLMFIVLLRSFVLGLLALVPNVIAAAAVISVMGFSSIPMDMMTITIAAICIGIGVDDAIHYLHRFREEYTACGRVRDAVREAHLTIGRAMYFTSVIIMVGFSILAFSNFLPTVYFGILTALAMLLAMLANLTVLPSLLIVFYRRGNRSP
ncbi:MAG: MMPL family transporter [Pseudomonadota bacterium]